MGKFNIKVNNLEQVLIDKNEIDNIHFNKISEDHFHFIKNNISYDVIIKPKDRINKKLDIWINGKKYNTSLLTPLENKLKSLGLTNVSKVENKDLLSPMPGIVFSMNVKIGDIVEPGTPLLILEAMKMENVLKSKVKGNIKEILVSKGDNVKKGDLLIRIE